MEQEKSVQAFAVQGGAEGCMSHLLLGFGDSFERNLRASPSLVPSEPGKSFPKKALWESLSVLWLWGE